MRWQEWKTIRSLFESSETLREPSWASIVEIFTGTTWPLRSLAAVGGGDLLLSLGARINRDGAGLWRCYSF